MELLAAVQSVRSARSTHVRARRVAECEPSLAVSVTRCRCRRVSSLSPLDARSQWGWRTDCTALHCTALHCTALHWLSCSARRRPSSRSGCVCLRCAAHGLVDQRATANSSEGRTCAQHMQHAAPFDRDTPRRRRVSERRATTNRSAEKHRPAKTSKASHSCSFRPMIFI